MAQLPVGVVSFLLTDIEGSTRLFQQLGDAYVELLDVHDRVMRAAIASNGGVEIHTQGDSFFVAFTDVHDAVTAAIAIECACADQSWPGGADARVRVGIDTGEAFVAEGEYVSVAVDRVRRVEAAAHGGQVLLSESAAAACGAMPSVSLVDLGLFWFDGFDAPQRLYQLAHPGLATMFPPPRASPAGATNIAAPARPLPDRDNEIAAVRSHLAPGSVVTLVGPRGPGKSALARQVAAAVGAAYPDGVWLVDFAGADDGSARARLASVIDVGVSTRDHGRTLLVFDNCESALDDVAVLVDELLTGSPLLSVLATSREPLRVADEQVVPAS